jgi:phage-related baseplate assembly protein
LLGHDIPLSGIYAALHQIGVQRVVLNTPTENIVVARQQAAYCDGIIASIGGLDE